MTADMAPHLSSDDGPEREADIIVAAICDAVGQPRWRVDGTKSGEWIMAKAARTAAELERITAEAADWRERIDRWEADTKVEHLRTLAWAEGHLTDWLRRLHEDDPKVLSVSLPSGAVRSRAGSPRWKINPFFFVPWALVNDPDMVRVTPALAVIKSGLVRKDDQAVTLEGEIVPGVSVSDGERTFTVRPN
jgi:hypothetical protein